MTKQVITRQDKQDRTGQDTQKDMTGQNKTKTKLLTTEVRRRGREREGERERECETGEM